MLTVIDFEVSPPSEWRSAFTPRASAEGEGRYIRQASCPGHFAIVTLRLEPYHGAQQACLEWRAAEEDIPSAYLPAILEGIRRAAAEGVDDGRPIINVKVVVMGGAYHEVDSRSASYRVAAAQAFKNAVMRADLALIAADPDA
jgi:elongation factor G